jgi:Flp pilus assembly protein TadB
MRSHVTPNVFRFIGLLILAVGVIVSISSGVGAGLPLFAIALVMFGLWWYQRRRLARK